MFPPRHLSMPLPVNIMYLVVELSLGCPNLFVLLRNTTQGFCKGNAIFYFFKIIHTNGYSHKHDFNQNAASYHISRTAPAGQVAVPRAPGQTPTAKVHHGLFALPSSSRFAVPSSLEQGDHAKLRKNSRCFVFLNYSKNKQVEKTMHCVAYKEKRGGVVVLRSLPTASFWGAFQHRRLAERSLGFSLC